MFLNLDDFDYLMEEIKSGTNLIEFLKERIGDSNATEISVVDYLSIQKDRIEYPEYLSSKFKEIIFKFAKELGLKE